MWRQPQCSVAQGCRLAAKCVVIHESYHATHCEAQLLGTFSKRWGHLGTATEHPHLATHATWVLTQTTHHNDRPLASKLHFSLTRVFTCCPDPGKHRPRPARSRNGYCECVSRLWRRSRHVHGTRQNILSGTIRHRMRRRSLKKRTQDEKSPSTPLPNSSAFCVAT